VLACYGSSLGSNPDISQKYLRNDIISKGGANTLKPAKKFYPHLLPKSSEFQRDTSAF
jgi:hypothetical protein